MKLIPLSDITIPPRQRKEIKKPAIFELRDSILDLGLLQPIVVSIIEGTPTLVAGERRLLAISLLSKEGLSFRFDGKPVKPGLIPTTTLADPSALRLFLAEFHENFLREALSWPDQVRALAEHHRLRQESIPEQTLQATAHEMKQTLGDGASAPTESALRVRLSRASIIAPHLDDPKVANARNASEAYSFILKRENERVTAELIRRRGRSPTSTYTLKTGDALSLMPTMDEEQFDLILTDPPYGISVGAAGFRERSSHHHDYDDSPEKSRSLLRAILTEGWRLCKPKANLFIFTDIAHFDWLQTFSAQMGWTPWRRPLIWKKSLDGFVPWGRMGFIYTYDLIFWATKGRRGITGPHVDILDFPRVSRNKRLYGAEKPLSLLSKLIELSTFPGESVFDPCAGSGSTLVAARTLNRLSYGIEIDPEVADLALVRLNEGEDAFDSAIDLNVIATPIGEGDVS